MFSNNAQTQRNVLNSISHPAFNVLNILMETGYIQEWWPHIIIIIYTFLILQLPECIKPKQSLAPPPTNTLHSPQLLWTTHRFSSTASNLLHLFSWLQTPTTSFNHLWFLPKSLKYYYLFSSKTAFNASCTQYCFMEDKNYQVNPPQLNIVCIISKICLYWHPNLLR
jgi:hypothetical protein